jgi:hypothetical protein
MVDIREHNEGSVHTLPEDGDSSTRSTRSIHTEAEHLEHDEYDMDTLPYPLSFSPIPRFPLRRGDMVLNVSNDKHTVVGETSNGSFTNSVTPTAPNAVIRRLKKRSIAGDPDQEI